MRVLHSKHQKLILQCYPPGKSTDKKPNPLELSYLLYYASTRRVKLEKVIDFLNNKTKSDARGNKTGNLQVTLSIVSALIEKCLDNLNAFALQVCSILLTILNLKELPLCKSLALTYGVLCAKLDNGLFTGDKEFVDLFTQLTQNMISTGESQLKVETTNLREWKMVSLLTSRHVFHCLGFNARISKTFLSMCVPLLILTVHKTTSNESLLARLNSNLNVETSQDKHLGTSTSNKTAPPVKDVEFSDERSLTEDDLTEEALLGLKTLFNTSFTVQIADATREVVENDFKVSGGVATSWGTNFLEMCASWIPVQLRFIALQTLLYRLSATSEQANIKSNNFEHLKHFAKYLLSLVSSDFNMIGLSISDITQQLLSLQTNLHLNLADYLSMDQVNELSSIYSQCICSLSTHIYYFDQVSDSIEGILMQIDSVLIALNASTVRVHTLVLTLLNMISVILKLLTKKSCTIARNHATLENWYISLNILTIGKSYEQFFSSATPEQVATIQEKYLSVFSAFLATEMIWGDERTTEDESIQGAEGSSKFLTPNYNEYIKNKDNILASILGHSYEFFVDPSYNIAVASQLAGVLMEIQRITGVNFIYNFILYFDLWQTHEISNNQSERAKDTTAYILLRAMIEILDDKYADSFESDVHKLRLFGAILADIKNRQSTNFWLAELDSGRESGIPHGELSSEVSSNLIYSFFGDSTLKQWISAQTAVFDLANGNGHLLVNGNGDGPSELVLEQYNQSRSRAQSGGLGLGTANDITSIYSGLIGGSRGDGRVTPDVSHVTADTIPSIGSLATHDQNNYKYSLMPRVEDLKQSVNGSQVQDDQFSFANARPGSSPRSVLQKQIHTTDVYSILNDLRSEDDNDIVV